MLPGSNRKSYSREQRAYRAVQLRKSGITWEQVAEDVGASESTVRRWVRNYRHGQMKDKSRNCGRKAIADVLSEDAKNKLRALYLQTGSEASAVQFFKDDPLCPSEFREYVLNMKARDRIAASIRAVCRAVTDDVKLRRKGPKAYQNAYTQLRGDTEIMPDGSERKIQPGDWWEFDDMSVNTPFWYELSDQEAARRAKSGDRLAEKLGVGMGRQVLFCQDLATGKWLGSRFVGRNRDAYRAADILWFFQQLFADYGKPRRGIRLEKGVWKSKAIDGHKFVVPDEDQKVIIGGLQGMGVEVVHVHSSKGKGHIESGFNHLQRYAETIPALNIGRGRGERERETKKVTRSKAGTVHPREIGVMHINIALGEYKKIMVRLNGEKKEGRIQSGIPDVRWFESITENPLREVSLTERGVLMPDKRKLKVREGHLWVKVGGNTLQYTSEAIFRLGDGYSVMLACDPYDLSEPGYVYNMESGANNHLQLKLGECIGKVTYQEPVPQFNALRRQDSEAKRLRRKFHAESRSAYTSTGIGGKLTSKSSEFRDGEGLIISVDPAESTRTGSPHTSLPGDRPHSDRTRVDSDRLTDRTRKKILTPMDLILQEDDDE